jgi:eukaryotic-like serine/threonine-protein kinase
VIELDQQIDGEHRGRWLIDGCLLHEATREVERPDGAREALDRSAFEILRYLLLNAGEVCTQEELLHVAWPGRVVTVNSLTKSVGRLRRALADEDGRRIAVVHRYGYRLVAAVQYQAASAPAATHEPMPASALETIPQRPTWRVLRKLGRGGCGDVWLAVDEQGGARAYKLADSEMGLRGLKREVALFRLIETHHPGLDSADPLCDWNLETPPFFVATRYHPGGNLAQWCAEGERLAQLPMAQRLALAQAICEAVAALHEADIAHRDLKPENLYPLDDTNGRVRIVVGDLGIGSGLLPPGIDASGLPLGQLTRIGEAVGEPASGGLYLAPEVLTGSPVTAKSDLYALGVLTYQLVVGDLRRALAPGWQHSVDDPLLREDIEDAANLEPARRTLGARQLAQRIAALPVRHAERARLAREAAEREEALQRVRQLRRRWRYVIAASLVLAAIAALTGGFAWQAEQLRAVADQRLRESRAVREFLTRQLLAQANPFEGRNRDITLKQALDVSAGQVEARFGDVPETAAEVHLALAEIYEGWAEYAPALRHQRAGLGLLRQASMPSSRLAREERLLCLYARRAGEATVAADACAQAARLDVALGGAVSPATRVAQAKLDYDAGQCAAVIQALGSVIDAPAEGEFEPRTLADALWFRGLCLAQEGQFLPSRRDFERLIPLREQLDGPSHPDLGWALMDFAETSIIAGDFVLARPLLERAQAIFTERLGPDHVDTQVAHYEWARIAHWGGDPASAVPLFERVLDHWQRSLGDEHLWPLYTRAELGWARAQVGDRDGALEALVGSQRIAEILLKDNPTTRSFFREVWIRTHLALGDLDAAEAELPRLREDLAAGVPATHPRWALIECLDGEIALGRGRIDAARTALDRCDVGLDRALAGLPPENYRRQWAAELRRRLSSIAP